MTTRVENAERGQGRQFVAITAAAVGVYFALRWLPTGTNLSHMDFRVDPKAGNAIEFCDPANPQFIPVVAARSPVTMSVRTAGSGEAVAGREVAGVVELRTGSGKPVAPEDLIVSHTRPLHLLIVDPTLQDYQHVHPTAAQEKGTWNFAFTPRRAGAYRVFGDFTPAATGRGLYASADMEVKGAAGAEEAGVGGASGGEGGAGASGIATKAGVAEAYQFSLDVAQRPARAGQPMDLKFAVVRGDGGAVPLQPVMGAFAHLVAFDEGRSGFAHLHPVEADVTKAPDARRPELNFKLTIPKAGRYVVWAQVNLGGEERFVAFEVGVE